jgi:hypothetical protein
MKSGGAIRQRGAALLALLAVVALAASWFLVRQLNTESGAIAAARTNRNAAVLNKAKQALIGYIAAQAAKDGENNPGAMPCPENPGDFDSTTGRQGLVGTSCGTTTIGRFPWRTLGLDRLVDSSGEPLWYVVGPGWGVATGSNTVINSNSVGQLTVDGVPNSAIALIIAPGPAFSAAAAPAAGCAAWSQARLPTGIPDWRNYLECENASSPADANFVTTGPSGSFNDQVITITVADVLPAIEAAIASRIEREIAPQLRSLYSGGSWSGTAAAPALPFAAPFADPSASAMQGTAGTVQGLLPLSRSETAPASGVQCTPGVADPRCDPMFVAWTGVPVLSDRGGGATLNFSSCAVTTVTVNPAPLVQTTRVDCSFRVFSWSLLFPPPDPFRFRLTGSTRNVGMALRSFNTATTMTGVSAAGRSASGTLNADGSATVVLNGEAPVGAGNIVADALCGLPALGWIWELLFDCYAATISVPITLLADHRMLDATTTGTGEQGWFLRNRWHEVAYYATAPGFAPSGAKSCIDSTTCLSVAYHRNAAGALDAGKQRAIVVLAGRALNGQTRPTAVPTDYLEGANTGNDLSFEVRSATLASNRSFNDRVAVLDANP